MRILVYTDGSAEAEEAIALLKKLGAARGAEVTVLGVPERQREGPAVEESVDRIGHALEDEGSSVKSVIRSGEPSREITDEAKVGGYDLVIVARSHRQGPPRLRFRSTTGNLARTVPAHLLIARDPPDRLNRILICSGAESPSAETIRIAGWLTAGSGARVSLLHVMSQVGLLRDSPAEDLEQTAEQAIEASTPEGAHLSEAVTSLRDQGVKAEILPILRHGLVVDEVLKEIEDGDYDLLVLGSRHQPAMTRWMDVLLDDVTGELLNRAPISTLVIYPPQPPPDAVK